VSHPNVATIPAFEELDGQPFIVVVQDERELSLLLVALGIGAAAALLLIEPVTTRAAFGETAN
jgi:hypothetical protein